jgi:hypothetical protein
MVGNNCGLFYVGSCLCYFKNCLLGRGSVICHLINFLSLILVWQHGIRSELNIWALILMLFSEECVSTEVRWAKEIR